MKRIIFLMLLCYSIALPGQHRLAPETVKLDSGWTFSNAAADDDWRPAVVPGTVHQDLLRHGLLPDPFYGINEQKVQWVENEDWAYRTTFTLTENQLARQAARLVFEGLDTYADVYLNGSLLFSADNMFKAYEADVKDVLRIGENRLHVVFHSPIDKALPQWETNGFEYPADNDHAAKKVSVFTRKAPYSYGWDWGIRLVTCGIWRPVSLQLYDVARVDDYWVKQLSLNNNEARLDNRLEIWNVADEAANAEVEIACSLHGKTVSQIKKPIVLQPGANLVQMPLDIEKPQRWMPNGWGEPTLYDFSAKVIHEGETIAEEQHRIGLRSIRVVTEKDDSGESFYFEVNGIPMFAKGANYIPSDALLPNVTTERYTKLFRNIKEANMNLIRVWGGGTYEDDRFYDLADENGILIWQDFMFACTAYPADAAFLQKVAEEAEYNIKRLRNHACLAMWCGNNEIEEGIKYWGWKKRYGEEIHSRFMADYAKLFHEWLPALVKKYDEGRFYMHTSPYFANWGRPDTWKIRDSHNWGIWYGKKPFESADEERCRFASEYGFQSFPEMKTIETFAAPEDYDISSEVMTAHQKSTVGNDLIATSMEQYFKMPDNFEDFVYVGQVLQGMGIRRSIEAHRRQRPYCMGTLYWQLNDSWPVVSWSGIDYYGNWKALHYQAKRAFEPLFINALNKGNSLHVYLMSDELADRNGLKLDMKLMNFQGKELRHQEVAVTLPANSSHEAYLCPIAQWAAPEERATCFMLLTLRDSKGKVLAQDVHYFAYTKDLNLPQAQIKCKAKFVNGRYEVTLSSKELAKDVFIQIPVQGAYFSDNFFDLLPGERRTITIEAPGLTGKEEINIKHIRETY